VRISPNLLPLIGMGGCKFSLEEKRKASSISSVNNDNLHKIARANSALNVINYHKFHFTRVYPSAMKIDSTNYNPMDAWILGA
jgi:phosphatidylinositol phospholipase C delta